MLPLSMHETATLYGLTDRHGAEGVVACNAHVFSSPTGPAVVAIEPIFRIDGRLPAEVRFVVVIVRDDAISLRGSLPLEAVGNSRTDPRCFMQEPITLDIEEGPTVHILRHDMSLF